MQLHHPRVSLFSDLACGLRYSFKNNSYSVQFLLKSVLQNYSLLNIISCSYSVIHFLDLTVLGLDFFVAFIYAYTMLLPILGNVTMQPW